jgi:hypothetical protein
MRTVITKAARGSRTAWILICNKFIAKDILIEPAHLINNKRRV